MDLVAGTEARLVEDTVDRLVGDTVDRLRVGMEADIQQAVMGLHLPRVEVMAVLL